MFSLIIVLISIFLVVALSFAVIYYGGSLFNQGSAKAKASEVINQAEQIKAAFTAYKIEKGEITINEDDCNSGNLNGCLNPLIQANYLTSIPQGQNDWYIDPTDKSLRKTLKDNVKACAIANFLNGGQVPSNPDNDALALSSMKTTDLTTFRKYIPTCASITTNSGYICCEIE